MGTRNRKWVGAWLCVTLIAGAASAQGLFEDGYEPPTPGRRGQSGLTFLQIGGSARAEGMGGVFIGVTGDPAAAFYNAAGLADVTGVAVSADHTAWVAEMSLNHFVAAWRIYQIVLAGTFVSMDYGEFQGTIIADNTLGYEKTEMISPHAWAAGGIVAMKLTDRFNAGVHFQYIAQDFRASEVYSWSQGRVWTGKYRDNRVTKIGIDIGTQYNTALRNISINMAFQHFSSTMRYVEERLDMPMTYRVGISADLVEVATGFESPTHKLMLHLEGIDRRDVTLDSAVGVEYLTDFSPLVSGLKTALRVGRRPARNQENWWAAGAGLSVPIGNLGVSFDYSYNDYGPHLSVQRVGIGLKLH